jgi:hypothetical protein
MKLTARKMTGLLGKTREIDIFVLSTVVKYLPTLVRHTRVSKGLVQRIQARCQRGASEQQPSNAEKGTVSMSKPYVRL